ncbi:MAG: hypothetical protein LBT71_06085 [Azoarcus sp.]|jgi:maltose O-acetyltransferase|nr:hypothetical protein [Azoarcus sp.]
MSDCCLTLKTCPAADKLRAWFAAGAPGRLTLTRADFPEGRFALLELLSTGPWAERMRQRWRSFCAWMGRHTPFVGWKTFWYRHAGVSIGENVHISPGVTLDLLFPQLITLEDGSVLGLGAIVVSHVYTPDRIVLGRTVVQKRAFVMAQGILAITTIGEESVLATYSYTVKPIPAGHIGIGIPATVRPRDPELPGEDSHDQRA